MSTDNESLLQTFRLLIRSRNDEGTISLSTIRLGCGALTYVRIVWQTETRAIAWKELPSRSVGFLMGTSWYKQAAVIRVQGGCALRDRQYIRECPKSFNKTSRQRADQAM